MTGTHPGWGETEGTFFPLLVCSETSPFPVGLKGLHRVLKWKGWRGWHSLSPARAVGQCNGPLCFSQIHQPGLSKDPRMVTTMSWMCPRSPPLPALGTSPRQWHRRGGSVCSPQVRGLPAALSPLQRHSMAGFGCGGGQGPSSRSMGAVARAQVGSVRGTQSFLRPQAPFCAVPKVGSPPLQVSQEPPWAPWNNPLDTWTMMMSATAPWGRCHEDVLAMPQPWGLVCGSVVGPCPQGRLALPTEVSLRCPVLQESSHCVRISFDFSVIFPFFLLKHKVVRNSLLGLERHSWAGTSVSGTPDTHMDVRQELEPQTPSFGEGEK